MAKKAGQTIWEQIGKALNPVNIGAVAAKLLRRQKGAMHGPPEFIGPPEAPYIDPLAPVAPQFVGFDPFRDASGILEGDVIQPGGELEGEVVPGVMPTPPLPPPGPYDAEIEALRARVAGAREQLVGLSTQAGNPQLSAIEQGLSGLAGQGITSPGTLSRIGHIPAQLAGQRAAALKPQIDAQQTIYEGESRMLGAAMNAKEANARVEGMLKKAEMDGVVKQAIAGAKNDTQLALKFVTLRGKGELNVQTGAFLLQEQGHGEDEALEISARLLADPTFAMRMKQAEVEIKNEGNDIRMVADARKAWRDVNATPDQRADAFYSLFDAGDPWAVNFYNQNGPKGVADMSEVKGAKTKDVEAQTAWRVKLTDKVMAETQAIFDNRHWVQAKRDKTLKEISVFDEEHQVKMARSKAQIDQGWAKIAVIKDNNQLQAMIANRKITQQDVASQRTAVNNGVTAATQQMTSLQARIAEKRELIEILKSKELDPSEAVKEYHELVYQLQGGDNPNTKDAEKGIGVVQQLTDLQIKKTKLETILGQAPQATQPQGSGGWTKDKRGVWVPNPSRGGGGGGRKARSGYRAQNQQIGRQIFETEAQTHGWSEEDWNALDQLWGTHESGWNNTAQNPTSSARGIAQFLDSTWKSTGYTKTDDPATQVKAGLTYIKNRYGSPSKALAFWKQRVPIKGKDVGNWY